MATQTKQELCQQLLFIEEEILTRKRRIVDLQMKLEPWKAYSDSVRRRLEEMGVDPVTLLFETSKEVQPTGTKPAEVKT